MDWNNNGKEDVFDSFMDYNLAMGLFDNSYDNDNDDDDDENV